MSTLFFTDIHFGRRNNSKEHNKDCYDFILWVCEYVKTHNITRIGFLGDWFENRNAIDVSTMNIAYEAAQLLSSLNIPVLFCVGNHDLYKRYSREHFSTIHYNDIPNFIIVDKPTIHQDILFCPFLFEEEYETLHQYKHIKIWAGHFEFAGFSITSYNTKKEGGPTHSLFDYVDLILSGHYHKRQQMDNTVYIGNVFPMDFSDVHDNERGICIMDADNKLSFVTWEDQPTYHRVKFSDISNKTFPSKSRVKCLMDIVTDDKDVLELKEQLSSLGVREVLCEEPKITFEELFALEPEEQISVNDYSTLKQLIDLMIDKISVDNINKDLLKQILNKSGEFDTFNSNSDKIRFKKISFKNFYSYGNNINTLSFDDAGLINLLYGENCDVVYDDNDKCRSGTGKAQPLDAKIKIPGGWTTMGDIEPGDIITGSKGLPINVIDTFPQGKKKIYKITFYDGRTTEACEDHLWEIHTRFKQKNGKLTTLIMSTAQIIQWLSEARPDRNHAMHISLIEHENIQDIALPMDPYLLGALLGDGSLTSTSIKFTNIDEHIIKRVSDIALREYGTEMISYDKGDKKNFVFVGGKGVARVIGEYTGKGKNSSRRSAIGYCIEQMGLRGCNSYNKFIPEIYKHSSYNQKIQLLQGLLDTDGTVGKGGDLSFSTSSLTLANDVIYLVRSLGGTATLSSRYPTYTYKGKKLKGQLSYYIGIRHSNRRDMVSIPRKLERLSETYQYADLKLRIKNVEYVGEKEAKCILVDDPSHLYVTDNFVVTHNTTILNVISYCLYDRVIKDNVTFDDMINNINKNNMYCELVFEKSNTLYKIVRRRKFGKSKINDVTIHIVDNDSNIVTDLTKDSSSNTNKLIKDIIGLQFETFTRMVLFTATNVPFFTLPVTSSTSLSQTDILEDLFRLKELTTKADNIKKYQKTIKDDLRICSELLIQKEKFNNQRIATIENMLRNVDNWEIQTKNDISSLQKQLENIPSNIDDIIQKTEDLLNYKKQYNELVNIRNSLQRDTKDVHNDTVRAERESISLKQSTCPYCKQQHFDPSKIKNLEQLIATNNITMDELAKELLLIDADIKECDNHIRQLKFVEEYSNITKTYSDRMVIQSKIEQLQKAKNPFEIALDALDQNIEPIDYTVRDSLQSEIEHCDFLVKLLTKKDSFVRKSLLKQNLPYLNTKLNEYLTQLKLPHLVYFNEELMTKIELNGRDFAFSTISNGQVARVNIALCLAFRDVISRMHSPINILMLDECLDTGLSSNGVNNTVKMIRDKALNENIQIFIVTHRDEITHLHYDSKFKVTYQNNFSNIEKE